MVGKQKFSTRALRIRLDTTVPNITAESLTF